MLEINRGTRPEPAITANATQLAFSRFKVSLGSACEDRTITIDIANWIESEIQQSYGYDILEYYHDISSLISVISTIILNRKNNNLWL